MLCARIAQPKIKFNLHKIGIKGVYSSMEVVTNSPRKFHKWCMKKGCYFHLGNRHDSVRQYNEKFKIIKFYYRSDSNIYSVIEDYWGFYNPEYDNLSPIGKLFYKIKYYFGVFEKLPS